MATTRIMPLHVGKDRTESRAISDIIDYVANPQKTDNGRIEIMSRRPVTLSSLIGPMKMVRTEGTIMWVSCKERRKEASTLSKVIPEMSVGKGNIL